MKTSSKAVFALLMGVTACDPRPRLEILEGQVTVSSQHCNWTPIAEQRPDVFDASTGLEVREAVGVSVAFSAFWKQTDSENLVTYLEGPWTVISDDPGVAEAFSAPNNNIAIIARSPGTATLTLRLVGHPGSFDVPIDVVAAESFEGGSSSAGTGAGSGAGGSGEGAGGAGGGT